MGFVAVFEGLRGSLQRGLESRYFTSLAISWSMIFALGVAGCGPGQANPDCVAVDEQLGVPGDRQWCDGQFYPEDLEWQGQASVETLPICLPPQVDGSCELCPTEKVIGEVELGLQSYLEEFRPMCQLEHWEFGCMRTIEHAIMIGRDQDYCCFQVALWGPFCADQP